MIFERRCAIRALSSTSFDEHNNSYHASNWNKFPGLFPPESWNPSRFIINNYNIVCKKDESRFYWWWKRRRNNSLFIIQSLCIRFVAKRHFSGLVPSWDTVQKVVRINAQVNISINWNKSMGLSVIGPQDAVWALSASASSHYDERIFF